MPARLYPKLVPPRRIRTFLILFALALTLPLLLLAAYAFDRMASLEEAEIERRTVQVAQDLAGDIDRELDRVMITLETLATAIALRRADFAAFHEQANHAINPEQAGILLVDRDYKQLINTRAPYGTALPPTSDPETAKRVFDTGKRQVSDVFVGVISRRPVINAEVPVFVDGEARYALVMAIDAANFARILQSQRLESGWVTGITDNKGIILARSERHDDFVGKPLPKDLLDKSRSEKGAYRAISIAGTETLRSTVRSQQAG